MRVGIFLSTLGGSPLQVGMERGLVQLGHRAEEYRPGQGYDLVLIFNQTAHNPAYVYPPFPPRATPIAFIDSAEYGYFHRLPGVIRDFANAFAPGSMAHDTKNRWQQERLRYFLEGRSFPYFLREFSKFMTFPDCYHPIDYPLYAGSVCREPPNRAEYLERQLDLFLSWGGSHPWRLPITEALRGANTKCEVSILGYNGAERIPQPLYFERMHAAKCGVSFDGYGSGSFRMTEVLVRSLLLMGPLMMNVRAPLIDGETCITYQVCTDGEEFVSTDIAMRLRQALADPEGSWEIYRNGYEHCMTHLTEKATAAYVLNTIHRHDWRQPTPLDIACGK